MDPSCGNRTNKLAGKHIEIQIFGDSSGHCISLFERECSIQRRHQKVIEEAPSPYMTPQLRKKMSDAAIELGALLKYEGAGTVEFIVDAQTGGFYFLEVNTRVQVLPLPAFCLSLHSPIYLFVLRLGPLV